MGIAEHHGSVDLKAEWEKMVVHSKKHGRDNVYLDYWNGIGFKMNIPCSLQESDAAHLQSFPIDCRRYDDRNTIPFAKRIGDLLRRGAHQEVPRVQTSSEENKLVGLKHTAQDWSKSMRE